MRVLKHALWPNKITLDITQDGELADNIETWLGEHMGPYKCKWNVVWFYTKVDYYFRDEKDAMFFSLKWA